jgi:hypothetical protein
MPDTIACVAELTVDRPRADTIALFTGRGGTSLGAGLGP